MKITKNRLTSALRRLWMMDDNRAEAILKSKTGKKYQCNHCKKLFTRKEIQVDHIEGVADMNIFTWDEYITRLFHNELQVLCIDCHLKKTNKKK
jgi:5-methylcytosine-specific restriction endonuclease McrA